MSTPQPPLNLDPRLHHVTRLIAAERLDEAEAICTQLEKDSADDPVLLHAQGLIDYMRRRYDQAIARFQAASKTLSDNPNLYGNLGEALRRKGDLEAAIQAFQNALLLDPYFPKAHLGLANILAEQERHTLARNRFQFLIKLHPNFAPAYHYLGVMLTAVEQAKEAIPLLRKAIALQPGYYEARFSLANALEQVGQTQEACQIYQELLREKPEDAAVHNNYANLMRSLGFIEDAEAHLREAAKHDPRHVSAYFNRSAKSLAKDISPETARELEALFEDPNLREGDRISLHFTLAKYYECQKNYEKAFHHYQTGNDIDHRVAPYNPDNQEKLVEVFQSFFTQDFFASRPHMGCESDLPVFIFGMPRSGTTLVEQILSSHPQVFGAGELKFLAQTLQVTAQTLQQHGGYPACLTYLDPVQSCLLGERYLEEIRTLAERDYTPRENQSLLRITDKMPGNFLSLGLVALLMPKAKLIHCRRDPMDSCLSCYTQRFTQVISYTRKLEDLGHYYRHYEELMAHWHKVLPMPILDVQYEETVQDPEAMSRKIIEFVGLEWHEDCLNFHQNQRKVKTASVEQVREPIYTSSVGKWRRYEAFLAPLAQALGPYATSFQRPAEIAP